MDVCSTEATPTSSCLHKWGYKDERIIHAPVARTKRRVDIAADGISVEKSLGLWPYW